MVNFICGGADWMMLGKEGVLIIIIIIIIE